MFTFSHCNPGLTMPNLHLITVNAVHCIYKLSDQSGYKISVTRPRFKSLNARVWSRAIKHLYAVFKDATPT